MSDALACIRFGVDDVTRSDALQDARVLLRHRFRPDVADAGVQQVSGGDHRRLDAVSDGDDGGVEIGRVELLDGEHVGHVGLNGGNLRGPPVDQFGILVDGEHVLPHGIQRGRHRTAESSQSDDQNAPVVACHAIILSAAVRGDAPVPPSWTPPILRAAVNGTASTS
mgnify:CR=1 FL=1